MHTDLMAEIVRSRSEELQRRAASVRIARAAAARHPRRRPGTRRRPDLFRGAESIACGSPVALQGNGSRQNLPSPI
jgi:hypothetical protein